MHSIKEEPQKPDLTQEENPTVESPTTSRIQ